MHSALACTNLAVGAPFLLEFIFLLVIWQSMTFRPRDPQVLLAMNDTAWPLFVCITSAPAMQAVVMGIAVLSDRGERPVFPRWTGYLDFWVAVLRPADLVHPLGVFSFWMFANTALTLEAVNAPEAITSTTPDAATPADPAPDPVTPDAATLAAELRDVRTELARMAATRT